MIYEYLCSKIISSDACNWDNVGIVGVAVTVKMTKASELITSIHQITESSCIPWIDIGLAVPLESSKFQTICLKHSGRGYLELISLWRDSTLWSLSLCGDGSVTRPWQIMKLSLHELTSLDALSVCTMDSSKVAVLDMRRSPESTECCISVVDTKFKLVSGRTSFQMLPTNVESDELQQCQISLINDCLIAVCDSKVFLTHCDISMPPLLSVAGRQRNTEFVPPPVALSGLAWLAATNDEIKVSIVDPWLGNLLDSKKTPDSIAFDTKYGANVGETKPQRSGKGKKKIGSCTEEQMVDVKLLDVTAGQHILIQTVSRCLSDTTFWPSQSLLDMINRFSLPVSCSLDLISLAIKHSDAVGDSVC